MSAGLGHLCLGGAGVPPAGAHRVPGRCCTAPRSPRARCPRHRWGTLPAASLLAALLLSFPATAHERTVSHSSWEIDGAEARVTVRLSALDVSRLPWAQSLSGPELDRQLGAYLAESLSLRAGNAPCALRRPPERLASAADRVTFGWQLDCPAPAPLEVRSTLLAGFATGHLHFARLRRDGAAARERVLGEAQPAWPLDTAGEAAGTSLAGYVLLGIEHILTGYDHLVFLLGLLLLGGTLRDLVRIVTGFTVAHSLTLALAVTGVVRPAAAPIEALIGLSIALVATENLWLAAARPPAVRWGLGALLAALALAALRHHGQVPALTLAGLALFTVCYFGLLARLARPAPLRAAVAFVFGLVHGFGFAGVLLESERPAADLAAALFGFNAGVELGQVAAVLALWPLLQLVARWRGGRWHRAVVEYGSAAILAVGVFWFVSRSYG